MIAKRFLATASRISQTTPYPAPVILPMGDFSIPQRTAWAAPRRHAVPSVWMRAGTSKGLYIHRHHLPVSEAEWPPIILSAMGSQDGDNRQLNGVGGATSTTSKVAVVSKSRRPGVDVDYTFIQVAPNEARIDMSGNCGNIASGVGPFALDEGLVAATPGQTEMDIRVFNTNTNRLLVERVQVGPDGYFREDGDYHIAGVRGTGSCIKVAFTKPAGAMTGTLFPSDQHIDTLKVKPAGAPAVNIRATLLDAANPFVFVDFRSMPSWYHDCDPNDHKALEFVELIRREGAVKFGLAKNTEAAANVRGTPKIAVLSRPRPRLTDVFDEKPADIAVQSFSMGKPHPSFQLTGAVCLAAAVKLEGTVAWELSNSTDYTTPPHSPGKEDEEKDCDVARDIKVCIQHGSGQMIAEVELNPGKVEESIESVSVFRTARRLFEGSVFF